MVQIKPPSGCSCACCLASESCTFCDPSAAACAIDRVNLRWAAGAPPVSSSPPFPSKPPIPASSVMLSAEGPPPGIGNCRTASGVWPVLLLAVVCTAFGEPPSPKNASGRLRNGCLKYFKISIFHSRSERPAVRPKSRSTACVIPGDHLITSHCPGRSIVADAGCSSVICPCPLEFCDPPSLVRRELNPRMSTTRKLAEVVLTRVVDG